MPDFDTQYAMAVDAVEDYIAHRDDPIDAQEISLRFEVQAARAADGRFALMARDHFNGNIDFQRLQKVNALLKEKYAGSRKITPAEIVKVTEDFFNYDYGAETMSYIDELPWSVANHVNLNYGKVLALGYEGILRTVEEKLRGAIDAEAQEFYEAVRITRRARWPSSTAMPTSICRRRARRKTRSARGNCRTSAKYCTA